MSKITLSGNASGTGTLTIASPNTDSDATINLPTVTGGSFIVSDASGNVGIGTSSPAYRLSVAGGDFSLSTNATYLRSTDSAGASTRVLGINATNDTYIGPIDDYAGGEVFYGVADQVDSHRFYTGGDPRLTLTTTTITSGVQLLAPVGTAESPSYSFTNDANTGIFRPASDTLAFAEGGAERARIDSSGNFFVAKTSSNRATAGFEALAGGTTQVTNLAAAVFNVNRQTDDGTLVVFYQANTAEGNISVSGTTVSYNGGHLSRWAQTTTAKDESLVKGTVLSNLDEMNVYTDAEGNPVENEQLNKVKVSDVEGDANVAGVFVNWDHDDAHNVDEINMAMTGDMIIRIAEGVTVARGDLLMSAGDGTAKPQGDDIVRSKTIAKVTSTHVTCTYADGSFCVPCVLMAC